MGPDDSVIGGGPGKYWGDTLHECRLELEKKPPFVSTDKERAYWELLHLLADGDGAADPLVLERKLSDELIETGGLAIPWVIEYLPKALYCLAVERLRKYQLGLLNEVQQCWVVENCFRKFYSALNVRDQKKNDKTPWVMWHARVLSRMYEVFHRDEEQNGKLYRLLVKLPGFSLSEPLQSVAAELLYRHIAYLSGKYERGKEYLSKLLRRFKALPYLNRSSRLSCFYASALLKVIRFYRSIGDRKSVRRWVGEVKGLTLGRTDFKVQACLARALAEAAVAESSWNGAVIYLGEIERLKFFPEWSILAPYCWALGRMELCWEDLKKAISRQKRLAEGIDVEARALVYAALLRLVGNSCEGCPFPELNRLQALLKEALVVDGDYVWLQNARAYFEFKVTQVLSLAPKVGVQKLLLKAEDIIAKARHERDNSKVCRLQVLAAQRLYLRVLELEPTSLEGKSGWRECLRI